MAPRADAANNAPSGAPAAMVWTERALHGDDPADQAHLACLVGASVPMLARCWRGIFVRGVLVALWDDTSGDAVAPFVTALLNQIQLKQTDYPEFGRATKVPHAYVPD